LQSGGGPYIINKWKSLQLQVTRNAAMPIARHEDATHNVVFSKCLHFQLRVKNPSSRNCAEWNEPNDDESSENN